MNTLNLPGFGFDPAHVVGMRVEMASDNDEIPIDWPCQIVRRASGLMKQRAQAATPGTRKIVEIRDAGRFDFPNRILASWSTDTGGEATTGIGDMRLQDAEHLAPWTAPVAVAVADAWERQADDMGDGLAHLHACAGEPGYTVLDEREVSHADWTATLRAALAYLREEAPAVTS